MNIQPLGEQIIIKTIPQTSIGSILVPDSAKGITMMGNKGAEDAVHFVEAEVVAVGPGKRQKGDATLLDDCRHLLARFNVCRFDPEECNDEPIFPTEPTREEYRVLRDRIDNLNRRLTPLVQPGDRILYHPAVQKFDREITDLMNGDRVSGERYFIIREDSVLAVIER